MSLGTGMSPCVSDMSFHEPYPKPPGDAPWLDITPLARSIGWGTLWIRGHFKVPQGYHPCGSTLEQVGPLMPPHSLLRLDTLARRLIWNSLYDLGEGWFRYTFGCWWHGNAVPPAAKSIPQICFDGENLISGAENWFGTWKIRFGAKNLFRTQLVRFLTPKIFLGREQFNLWRQRFVWGANISIGGTKIWFGTR